MKLREDAKPDGAAALFSFSIVVTVCDDYFARVRDFRSAQANRAREVRCMVVRHVRAGGDYAGLADVSVFEMSRGPVSRIRAGYRAALMQKPWCQMCFKKWTTLCPASSL